MPVTRIVIARMYPTRRAWLAGFVLVCYSAVGTILGAVPSIKADFPSPKGYVSDYARVLGDDWTARIGSVCRDLERKTGVEMVVVTTETIEPFLSPKEYAGELYKRWGIGTAQQEHGVLVLAHAGTAQATVTLGRNMIRVVSPALLEEVAQKYIDPSLRLGHYGEGLYRTVVALASASQEVRVGTQFRHHSKGLAFFLSGLAICAALGLFWWITRPDKRHPFKRVQQGEFWGSGRGGFGGNFGGFGGGTSGEGFS